MQPSPVLKVRASMKSSAAENLRRFYDVISGETKVLIAISADPDALASAMAVKRLLWRKVSAIDIASINIVKRSDNLTLVKSLGLKIIPLEEVTAGNYGRVVMVDSQPNHNEAFEKIQPQVVIDHHPVTCTKALFEDIRPEYGATSTIMTEYLCAAGITPSAKLATGLLYGIKTDTDDFSRPSAPEDVRAFQFLYPLASKHLVAKIEQAEIDIKFLRYYRLAIERMTRRKDWIFCHLGRVVSADVCVMVADFFLRVASINWSVVSGVVNKRLVVIFRNDGVRKSAGSVAERSFGAYGSAGGHKSMARAEINPDSIEEPLDLKDDAQVQRWLIKRIGACSGYKRHPKS
jgi:nanoRNase/pAp phosphatase (c-di-AMP/oligoRNAs hydrolase)